MLSKFHWSHHGFSLIWLLSALAFFLLAWDSYSNLWITLPRYEGRIPQGGNVTTLTIGDGPSFNEVIDGIADAHDQSVAKLEESIHDSAKLTLLLNLISGFASLGGFVTQIGAALHEHRSKHHGNENTHQPGESPLSTENAAEINQPKDQVNGHKRQRTKRWYEKIWCVHQPAKHKK